MAALSVLYPELSGGFVAAASASAHRLGIEPRFLMAVMDFESGFRADAVNTRSGATGLIQFTPATAAELGTSLAALEEMTAVEQLAFVEDYFAMRIRQRGPLRSLEDVYMAVLYPVAVGKGSGHRLFSIPSQAYAQNDYLDLDEDGHVTVAEATAFVRDRLRGGGLTDPITPDVGPLFVSLGSGLSLPWWFGLGSSERPDRPAVAPLVVLGLGTAALGAWIVGRQ